MKLFKNRFLSIDNQTYDLYAERYQAKTIQSKAFYLFAYLLPGILAYIFINIQPVHHFFSGLPGLQGYNFQYYMFVVFTLFWHMAFPIFMLRKHEKLEWKDVFEFLSLNRFSFKEVLLIAPLAFTFSVIFSLPYMMVMHQKPTDGKDWPGSHFHIEFYPPYRTPVKLKYLAGCETGAGTYVNDTLPEDKAKELKAVVTSVGV